MLFYSYFCKGKRINLFIILSIKIISYNCNPIEFIIIFFFFLFFLLGFAIRINIRILIIIFNLFLFQFILNQHFYHLKSLFFIYISL
jgi:hypothetical protein